MSTPVAGETKEEEKSEEEELIDNILKSMEDADVGENKRHFIRSMYYRDIANKRNEKKSADPRAYSFYVKSYRVLGEAAKACEEGDKLSDIIKERKTEIRTLIDQIREPLRERQLRVMKELQDTEYEYGKRLQYLLGFYEKFRANYRGSDRDAILKVFCATSTSVIAKNQQYLESDFRSMDQANPKLADCIRIFAYPQMFRSYKAFFHEHAYGTDKREDLRTDPKFNDFLEKNGLNYENLNSFLITPVQRLPRYGLLFTELLKQIPVEDRNYQPLTDICAQIKTVTKEVNDAERDLENMDQLIELGQRLGANIIQPNRRLVKQGHMKRLTSSRMRSLVEETFYLCSDIIFWVSADKMRGMINLRHSKITKLPHLKYASRGFCVTEGDTQASIIANDAAEMYQWKSAIETQIKSITETESTERKAAQEAAAKRNLELVQSEASKNDHAAWTLEMIVKLVRSLEEVPEQNRTYELGSRVQNLGNLSGPVLDVMLAAGWDPVQSQFFGVVDLKKLELALLDIELEEEKQEIQEQEIAPVPHPNNVYAQIKNPFFMPLSGDPFDTVHNQNTGPSAMDLQAQFFAHYEEQDKAQANTANTANTPNKSKKSNKAAKLLGASADTPPSPGPGQGGSPSPAQTSATDAPKASDYARPPDYGVVLRLAQEETTSKASEIVHSGWLEKRGPNAYTGYKKRYFVLRADRALHYFGEDTTENPNATAKGAIQLSSIRQIETSTTKSKRFIISLISPNRTFVLNALDKESWRQWLNVLGDAISISENKLLKSPKSPNRKKPTSTPPAPDDLSNASSHVDAAALSGPQILLRLRDKLQGYKDNRKVPKDWPSVKSDLIRNGGLSEEEFGKFLKKVEDAKDPVFQSFKDLEAQVKGLIEKKKLKRLSTSIPESIEITGFHEGDHATNGVYKRIGEKKRRPYFQHTDIPVYLFYFESGWQIGPTLFTGEAFASFDSTTKDPLKTSENEWTVIDKSRRRASRKVFITAASSFKLASSSSKLAPIATSNSRRNSYHPNDFAYGQSSQGGSPSPPSPAATSLSRRNSAHPNDLFYGQTPPPISTQTAKPSSMRQQDPFATPPPITVTPAYGDYPPPPGSPRGDYPPPPGSSPGGDYPPPPGSPGVAYRKPPVSPRTFPPPPGSPGGGFPPPPGTTGGGFPPPPGSPGGGYPPPPGTPGDGYPPPPGSPGGGYPPPPGTYHQTSAHSYPPQQYHQQQYVQDPFFQQYQQPPSTQQSSYSLPSNVPGWSKEDVGNWLLGMGPEFDSVKNSFLQDGVDGNALLFDFDEVDDLADLISSPTHRERVWKEIESIRKAMVQ